MKIVEKTNLFNVYAGEVNNSGKLIGVANEITLPEFENMSETLSLSGMSGEVDSPSRGQYKSAQMEIGFKNISKEMLNIVADDSMTIILRSAQETINTETMKKSHISRVITMKGMTKKVNYGKLAKGGYGEPSIVKEVVYYKEELDGEVITEVNKFGTSSIINGVNIMADVESLI